MTRINTNVSSLVAQNTLGRSNASLNEALTRLSTGLRINTGKDDPAGLIASENLRSDITSIRRAISNTDRANQVIATADSALGQVSSLLNDIRGLVTESANDGALSAEQIAANQLQVDSSLEALNRIAQTTTFQGRRLLDGSLDFITTAGTGFSNISDLKIDQANLGATGSVDVDINVTTAATQAQVDVTNVPAVTTPVAATTGFGVSFAVATAGTVDATIVNSGADDTITITADAATEDALNGVTDINVTFGAGADAATIDGSGVIQVDVTEASGVATVANIADAIQTNLAGVTTAVAATGTGTVTDADISDPTTATAITQFGRQAGDANITITAAATGTAANDATVTFAESGAIPADSAEASVDGSGNITINVNGDVTFGDIAAAIDGLADYNAAVDDAGDTNEFYLSSVDTEPTIADLSGGVGAGGIAEDVVLELAGSNGAEVLSFGAGTSLTDLVDAINLLSDATGVDATANGTTLELTSSTFGSSSVVDLQVISEGSGSTPAGTFTDAIAQGSRQVGADIVAAVNGVSATGNGNQLSINTATLDLTATIAADTTGTLSFSITGGGALFQLGPDVVSNQQARLGVGSVNTAQLGGVTGKLFELGTGGVNDLTSDNFDTAASIVEEAINEVTSLRGRLGAFQRTTLETNKQALNDTLVNLTEAESSIRDADFAAESAALTRAQILVQSGTTVLQIANSNPQNVLALLR